MSLDDIIANFNFAKSKKFTAPTIKHFITHGISREKIVAFVDKYEKIIQEAITEAVSYKRKYEELISDPVISAYIKQKARFVEIEDKLDSLADRVQKLENK